MGTNKFNVGEKFCKALVYAYPYAAAYLTSVNQALLCTRPLTWTVKSRMVLWSPASGIFLLLTSKERRLARTFSKLLVLGLCFKGKHFDKHLTFVHNPWGGGGGGLWLRFEGSKIHCSPRDQSLSDSLYSKTKQILKNMPRFQGPFNCALWSCATAVNILQVPVAVNCFPFDVIVFAMLPTHGI